MSYFAACARVTAKDDAVALTHDTKVWLMVTFLLYSLLEFTMTNEEPLPKKVSVL